MWKLIQRTSLLLLAHYTQTQLHAFIAENKFLTTQNHSSLLHTQFMSPLLWYFVFPHLNSRFKIKQQNSGHKNI